MARVRNLELILTANGGAELIELDANEDEAQVWASDSDDDFREGFPDFLNEHDAGDVLEYLVDTGMMSEEEADECELSQESLKKVNGDEDEDDDDGPLEGEFIQGAHP
jgi:hypothetical protein